MQLILKPEVMDTQKEAVEYDAMDLSEVNQAFVQRVFELSSSFFFFFFFFFFLLTHANVLDVGTGTARIPILIAPLRPASEKILTQMVQAIRSDYNDQQKQLFQDSLHAAFTLEEVTELIKAAGLQG